jgi:hypothetical protein
VSDHTAARHAALTARFPGWAATHPGPWDFSLESVDTLETLLRATFVPDTDPRVELPAWYLGEVIAGAKGGEWFYDPDQAYVGAPGAGRPKVRFPPPSFNYFVPTIAVRMLLRTDRPTTLRSIIDMYQP